MNRIKNKFTRTSTGRLLQTVLVNVLSAVATVHLYGQRAVPFAVGTSATIIVVALILLLTHSPIMHGKKE